MTNNNHKTRKGTLQRVKDGLVNAAKVIYITPTATRQENNGRYLNSSVLVDETVEGTLRGAFVGGTIGMLLTAPWINNINTTTYAGLSIALSTGLPIITNIASGLYEARKRNLDAKLESQGHDLSHRKPISDTSDMSAYTDA